MAFQIRIQWNGIKNDTQNIERKKNYTGASLVECGVCRLCHTQNQRRHTHTHTLTRRAQIAKKQLGSGETKANEHKKKKWIYFLRFFASVHAMHVNALLSLRLECRSRPFFELENENRTAENYDYAYIHQYIYIFFNEFSCCCCWCLLLFDCVFWSRYTR